MSDMVAFEAMGTRNGASQRYSLVAKLTDFKRPYTVMTKWSKDFHTHIEKQEVKFYSQVVPDLLSVATPSTERKSTAGNEDGEHHPPADPLFFPKCYFAATDPSSMVSVRVMENLKTQGFSIKPNRQPLSREEMILTVGAFAQLHGLSHRLEILTGKPLPEKYGWNVTVSEATTMTDVTILQYQTAVKDFAAAFPDQAALVARLEKTDPMVVFQDNKRLKVISHAGCWINNIMFKYAGDVPTDVRLVDWQTVLYQPLTFDLVFLFLCNATWDVFHNHRDDILAHYHRKLQETLGPNDLESSDLQSYTLQQLTVDFKADCWRGVIIRFMHRTPANPDVLQMIKEIQEWGFL